MQEDKEGGEVQKAEEAGEAEALMRIGRCGAVSGCRGGVLQADPREGPNKRPLSDAISCKTACVFSIRI